MKKWFAIVASLILIVSFQNCAPTALPKILNSNSKYLVGYDQKSISDYSNLTFGSFAVGSEYTVDLNNLDSGQAEVKKLDPTGSVVSNGVRCLSTSDISKLKAILKDAKVCLPILNYEALKGVECSQDYGIPYGSVKNASHEDRLGEKNNGCDVPKGLCDDDQDLELHKFANQMTLVLETQPCN
jgi:hypothetical protein